MKVLEPGHTYAIENIDGPGHQIVRFVKRRDDRAELLAESDQEEGIQSQELLRVLIDRTIYLHTEQPWPENVEIIRMLRHSLSLYESRAARRHIEKLSMIERHNPCGTCGHLLCFCVKDEDA